MTFVHRAPIARPKSIAIFAGAFNPPTVAHLALAEAALRVCDEVLLAIPRRFPHKHYEGATLEQRLAMMQAVAASRPGLSAGVAEGGLIAEIAREARSFYPEDTQIHILLGRDAAERILAWDYGDDTFVDTMLREFRLLVAPRGGVYVPEPAYSDKIDTLALEAEFDECSSTRLRDRIVEGTEDWRNLAPQEIAELIAEIYSEGRQPG